VLKEERERESEGARARAQLSVPDFGGTRARPARLANLNVQQPPPSLRFSARAGAGGFLVRGVGRTLFFVDTTSESQRACARVSRATPQLSLPRAAANSLPRVQPFIQRIDRPCSAANHCTTAMAARPHAPAALLFLALLVLADAASTSGGAAILAAGGCEGRAQAECGGECTWCRSAAVPSACYTLVRAAAAPALALAAGRGCSQGGGAPAATAGLYGLPRLALTSSHARRHCRAAARRRRPSGCPPPSSAARSRRRCSELAGGWGCCTCAPAARRAALGGRRHFGWLTHCGRCKRMCARVNYWRGR